MKATLRIIWTNIGYLGRDLVHAVESLGTMLCAFILLILQLIAAPFKWIAYYDDNKHAVHKVPDEHVDIGMLLK